MWDELSTWYCCRHAVVHYTLECRVKCMVTLCAPLAGLDFRTAILQLVLQSSLTTSLLLLVAIVIVVPPLTSLTGECSSRGWTEDIPPLPTKRHSSIALYTGSALIVAGGHAQNGSMLRTVEVLNTSTETLQWPTAADLPQSVHATSAVICGDHMYILAKGGKPSTYTCSTITLTQSRKTSSKAKRNARVWKKAAAPPVVLTACVTVHDRLLAIGGEGSIEKYTTALHMYDSTTDSWEVISHTMTLLYCSCLP